MMVPILNIMWIHGQVSHPTEVWVSTGEGMHKLPSFNRANCDSYNERRFWICSTKIRRKFNLSYKEQQGSRRTTRVLDTCSRQRRQKRIEEVIANAKTTLTDRVHRKLRYASGLLSQSQADECNTSNSPPPSPECLPSGHFGVDSSTQPFAISNEELKKVTRNLKSPAPSKGRV